MIAIYSKSLRLFLFFFLVFYSLAAHLKVESVELIYDENEVYAGNRVEATLKVTDHKGKIYFSNGYKKARYDFEDFIVSSSDRVNTSTFAGSKLYFSIPKDSEEIEIKLKFIYKKDQVFAFRIPVIDYESKVNAIRFSMDRNNVVNHEKLSYNLTGILMNGEAIAATHKGMVPLSSYQVSVLSGGTVDQKNRIIYVDKGEQICDPKLVVRVSLKSNPQIYRKMSWPIEITNKSSVHYNGENGTLAKKGSVGKAGTSHTFFRHEDGNNGNNGAWGLNGSNGAKGENLEIYVSRVQLDCFADSVVQVLITAENQKKTNKFYLTNQKQLLFVSADGGNGGNGGDGGDGGNGQHGQVYLLQDVRELSEMGDGGNGGNGGNGGHGGDGGEGGNIVVYYSPETKEYLDQIIISNNGGKGGLSGRGGYGGRGGDTGNGQLTSGTRGQSGISGQPGINGRDGRNGRISFVEIN